MESNNQVERHEYIIIGAGPAGLQTGYYFQQAGLDYLIIEAGDSAGTFFKRYPRHRKLISINKIYTGYDDEELNMRWDWNSLLSENEALLFKNYSKEYFPNADDMVRYLSDYAAACGLNVRYDTAITNVSRGGDFRLTDQHGNTYACQRLIVATGFTRPYVPPIPGIELAENYTEVSVNAEEFTNKRTLIIGKGNSAFETADNLIPYASLIHVASPEPLNLAWQTHFVGHLRAINNNILDTYQLKSQNALLNAIVEKIERRGEKYAVTFLYTRAHNEREELLYDRVIACTGFRFDGSIFDESCRPALSINDRFPAQTSEWESVSVKDLYFVGTLMQMRDFKKTTSGFIHGFRYNARALYRILARKYHGAEWPSREVEATPQALMKAVVGRVNQSSALWQQFGFLCDVIIVSDDGKAARYYEEMPFDYLQESDLARGDHYYTVTLEYGKNHKVQDPFSVERIDRNDIEHADSSNALHPIIRRFSRGTLVSEHHVIEDFASEWREEVHTEPLARYFAEQLAEPALVG